MFPRKNSCEWFKRKKHRTLAPADQEQKASVVLSAGESLSVIGEIAVVLVIDLKNNISLLQTRVQANTWHFSFPSLPTLL